MAAALSPAVQAARLLPDGLLRRLLPARMEFDGAEAHPLVFPEGSVRLFIGPANFAGQGWAWARAAERLPGVGAVSMASFGAGGYGFAVDQAVPASVFLLSRRWERSQRRALLERATHVIIESGRALLAGDARVGDEIETLRAAGVKVALLGHGSDVRDGRRHASSFEESPYRDEEWGQRAGTERASEAHRELFRAVGVPLFVSTPGLLDDVPGATWLPVVVDPLRWASERIPLSGAVEPPLVVHAPSSPVLKGTGLIEPVLEGLVGEGLIRYRRLTGVPADHMPSAFAEADIVLDQFRLGDYGVAACEAMAAGRIVIGNVHDDARARVRASTGLDLPVVQARAEEVGSTIRGLLSEPAAARVVAARGPLFVEAAHDGRLAAEALRSFLRS
ncbi:hypothetical protein [Microbacterium sp.]|uniref:hypothetical protein n=1 Tax=Microbacterium sp. TaxID=51671 RepID=UPI003341F57F